MLNSLPTETLTVLIIYGANIIYIIVALLKMINKGEL